MKVFTKERIAEIVDNQKEQKIRCPKCGEQDRIREKVGMFISLFTCETCGHEFREFESEKIGQK